MYISKIKLHNFKGFKEDHEIIFDKGVNFFVGDNNCGKSSVFEAIDFIRTKKEISEVITKTEIEKDSFVSVEIEFKGGDIEALVEIDALKKYKSSIINTDGEKSLRIMRSSEEMEINQAGKKKELDITNVRVFNPTSNQFENPTGIDNTITALFDAQFVWADTNSNDISDFSKTICSGSIKYVQSSDLSSLLQLNKILPTCFSPIFEGEIPDRGNLSKVIIWKIDKSLTL